MGARGSAGPLRETRKSVGREKVRGVCRASLHGRTRIRGCASGTRASTTRAEGPKAARRQYSGDGSRIWGRYGGVTACLDTSKPWRWTGMGEGLAIGRRPKQRSRRGPGHRPQA